MHFKVTLSSRSFTFTLWLRTATLPTGIESPCRHQRQLGFCKPFGGTLPNCATYPSFLGKRRRQNHKRRVMHTKARLTDDMHHKHFWKKKNMSRQCRDAIFHPVKIDFVPVTLMSCLKVLLRGWFWSGDLIFSPQFSEKHPLHLHGPALNPHGSLTYSLCQGWVRMAGAGNILRRRLKLHS